MPGPMGREYYTQQVARGKISQAEADRILAAQAAYVSKPAGWQKFLSKALPAVVLGGMGGGALNALGAGAGASTGPAVGTTTFFGGPAPAFGTTGPVLGTAGVPALSGAGAAGGSGPFGFGPGMSLGETAPTISGATPGINPVANPAVTSGGGSSMAGTPWWRTPGINPMAWPTGSTPQGPFAQPQIMGGLFQDTPTSPGGDARMALAASLLSSSGYSPTPTTNSEAIGRALLGAQQAKALALKQGQDRKEAEQVARYREAQIAAMEAKPEYQRVDLGDRIALIDASGAEVGSIPKGVDPATQAQQAAAAAERTTGRDFQRSQQEDQQVFLQEQARLNREVTAAERAAKKGTEPTMAEAKTKLGQVKAARPTLDKLQESSNALSDFQTGPLAGRRLGTSGFTDAEQEFNADMALTVGQILAATKVPGTGAQSDRDAARLDALTPQLTDDKKARNRKIAGLRAWLDEIEATQHSITGGSGVSKQDDPLGIR